MLLNKPIIVIGMHRSGTTLVSKILRDCGVNMGRPLDSNHESKIYMSMNEWILRYAGTTWQYPSEISRLLENEDAFNDVVGSVRRASSSLAVRAGHKLFNRKSVQSWGWKDPRNTITLPVWLSIYPEAKIINVKRHGVPVASSMVVRRAKDQNINNSMKYKIIAPVRPGILYGARIWDMQNVINMWDEYCDLAEQFTKYMGKQKLDLRYEDLLDTPNEEIKNIASFLNLSISDELIEKTSRQVSRSNAYKFREDEYLVNLEGENCSVLKKHGY